MTGHVIKRLPVETGTSGWEAISTRKFPVRELDSEIRADWLIIGAGFAGLSAARRLSQVRPGEKVVILDAQEVAQGAAGRNSGFMIDVPHNLSSGEYSVGDERSTALEIEQNRFAIAFAAESAAEYEMPSDVFAPSGKINAAATRRGLKLNRRFVNSLRRIGEPYELLDSAQMRSITGSRYYTGGVYTPGTMMIQPAEYIRCFAQGLGTKIDLFENSPVIEIKQESNGWAAISNRGSIKASKTILAVNGHAESFGYFRGRLMHVFTYASMTAAFSPNDFKGALASTNQWGLLPADPMGATVRKINGADGCRIVIRTHFTYDPSLRVSKERLERVKAEQRRSIDARFPELGRLPIEFGWAGAICLSRNHVPAFGEIAPGFYCACCENGLGTVKSTLAGIMAADLATGTYNDYLETYKNQPKPSKLPPEPLASLGINTVMRWMEFRAGREK